MSEIKVIGLEDRIKKELIDQNLTEAILLEIDGFGELKLKDINDKEGYLQIKENRAKAREIRTKSDDFCKKSREEANAYSQAWVDKQKEISTRIKAAETKMKAQEDLFEAEKERIKQEKIRLEQANLIKRQSELLAMGAQLIGDSFVLEDVSIDIVSIKEASDASYGANILPDFKTIFDRNEEIRIKKEREEAERKEKEEADRKELQKQQAELRRQQEEVARQMAEIQKVKNDAKISEIKQRSSQLQQIGLIREGALLTIGDQTITVGDWYFDGDLLVASEHLINQDKPGWDNIINYTTPIVEQKNKDKEQKRLADIAEKEKAAADKAVADERERVKKQQEKDAEDKRLADLAEAEKLDKANDSQKWVFFVDALNELKFPEMKSAKYRKFIAMAKEKVEEIKTFS